MNDERNIEIERRLATLEADREHDRALLDGIKASQDAMLAQLAVYNGRWGMLVMVGSSIMFLVATFKDFILKKLGMNG
jgi:hypothetical protein